ncbi:polycomb group protein Psc [Acyrthosiphon pisum]|uniref:RING-type domain-containing protein n=1 Tax=Acyrthosiphon pisum TaxID=7029 RepID=A0A8R2FD94_ACYPI|nr:polycomb group protein Psc [Acyrthosiphon pisum]|eukprot:XP_008187232.1 PREDICTED: polycomb group protein Psc [Acyrthosiphon pisum]
MSSSSSPPPPWLLQKLFGDPVVPSKGGRVKLTDVNRQLICVLCLGYLVDATSIVECLHSFCRSCIVLHLDKNNFCPICREDIQNSKVLKPDKALQDIVYKLVPGLYHSEMKRRQEFYQKHPHRDMHLQPECRGVSVDRIVYTADELISLSLEYYDKVCEEEMWKNVTDDKGLQYKVRTDKPQRCIVRKRYLKCPAAVRMSHLKKFIRLKYNLKPWDKVELLYRRESLPEEYSIMDIAYIYTWNRNEPMRFFYKINARMMVPVILPTDKRSTTLTDVVSTEPVLSPVPNTTMEMTPLSPQINVSGLTPIVESLEEDKKKTVPQLLKLSVTEEPIVLEGGQQSKTESSLKEPVLMIATTDVSKKDRRSSPPPPIEPLNPPISPEGSSRKENVSDNVRNNCAIELSKSVPSVTIAKEEEKCVDLIENQQTGSTTAEIPMKKLEKLVDQQQILPVASNPPPSALPLPKKHTGVGESKLNLSITKLIMKNKNASAAAKFVPTLQQMQQIGMHTSIPSFQQQQQQQTSSLQPNAYVRPGYPGMHPFKRTLDGVPIRSQASTNRPPFIPVRKSYEWNKARSLATKPHPSPVTNSVKDNKPNEKSPMTVVENPTKKPIADKLPPTVTNTSMLSKNLDEMNAAQSLLKVGQDLRLLKPSTVTDLHDKYNCESSLQITKVTEPETNQLPAAHENHSNSQPSLQIMRVPTATDKLTKPTATTEISNGNNSGNTVVVPIKPVNKKPVPSLYSMPTKRTKEDTNVQHNNVTDNNRIERRVDTENGVLSVSLLTETSKQDMDAKRREVVQPDVSIKLMTFATESVKKAPELSPIAGGSCNSKKNLDELNAIGSSGANNKKKLDELSPMVCNGINNKRKSDELSPIVGSSANNKRKLEDLNPISGGGVNKRKQEDPERKVTPPRLGLNKDDVPQLIEINSSPYAKLLPTKKQQSTPKQQQVSKYQPVTKQHSAMKQQPTSKLQPATKVLDLSKSPPNGCVKRLAATDVSGNCSSPNTKKSTSSVQMVQSTMPSATSAAINSNLLFAAQRQAAAYLLKQHFETLNNGLMRNGGKGPVEWPRAMFNPALFARPPTNLNN